MNPRFLRTIARVFWVVTVLAGMPFPAVASQPVPETPWGGDASLSGGTWAPTPAFHALADVNGDGFADLIFTLTSSLQNGVQTNVYVQYSNGTSFGAPVIVATDSSTRVQTSCGNVCHYAAQALINAVGDVNGDGHPDILFADGTVALGNGSGFGPKTPWGGDTSLSGGIWGAKPAFHALADVNGDGFADLIYTLTASLATGVQTNVYVQYSNGTSFGAPVIVATDSSTRVQTSCGNVCHYAAQALINAVGDVNGDGHPDILFADGTVALGNGSGFGPKAAWGGDTSLSGGTWGTKPAFHALVDVNGDGLADLIYTLAVVTQGVPSAPAINVYVQYSNGASFGAPVVGAADASTRVLTNCTEFTCHYSAQALINAVGDVNGDHQADILYANGSVSIMPINFTISPAFFIGSVIYVPPGQGPSSIAYGAGTVTGTTVSTTNSWSFDSTIEVSNSIGSESVTFGANFGGSTIQSVDMQNTLNQVTTYKAPPSDSINHDYDQIQIYLGVDVNAVVQGNNVTWGVDFSKIASRHRAETGYPITVGCLRGTIPSSQCTDTMNVLSLGAITSADYPSILGADPFADPNASPTPDPSRYVLIDTVFYFFDPTATTFTYTENNSTTTTNSATTNYSYSVASSLCCVVIPDADAKLKDQRKFTWTNSSTTSNKTGSTGSSTFTLTMPSSSYSGPTTLRVYLDTIYKTFMFSFN